MLPPAARTRPSPDQAARSSFFEERSQHLTFDRSSLFTTPRWMRRHIEPRLQHVGHQSVGCPHCYPEHGMKSRGFSDEQRWTLVVPRNLDALQTTYGGRRQGWEVDMRRNAADESELQ